MCYNKQINLVKAGDCLNNFERSLSLYHKLQADARIREHRKGLMTLRWLIYNDVESGKRKQRLDDFEKRIKNPVL